MFECNDGPQEANCENREFVRDEFCRLPSQRIASTIFQTMKRLSHSRLWLAHIFHGLRLKKLSLDHSVYAHATNGNGIFGKIFRNGKRKRYPATNIQHSAFLLSVSPNMSTTSNMMLRVEWPFHSVNLETRITIFLQQLGRSSLV